MVWNYSKSEARIRRYMANGPSIEADLGKIQSYSRQVLSKMATDAADFPLGRATLVEGVHLYGLLLDFDELAQHDRASEVGHARLLQFLDMNYRIWDALVEEEDAIRVDYHGPRLHAVVTEPAGDAVGQLQKAIALAVKLDAAAKRAAAHYGFPARVRFGLDHGFCLAMTTGRSFEKDVLFLGSPANHAAKLVASDRIPGIFLTDNAKQKLGLQGSSGDLRSASIAALAAQNFTFNKFEGAIDRMLHEQPRLATFSFHRGTPPLSNIKFADLSPANSVRMGMASLFADIDGYTRYVDDAIRNGQGAIRSAVLAVHVLREELNSVLKEDFGGKRVRFIGDCIHGLIAAGEKRDDAGKAVKDAALCASGMRSSFVLAQKLLGTIDKLDLAVGVEYGEIPLTRVGYRGNDSVRCAAASAVIRSEQLQQAIAGGGISLGPVALGLADDGMQAYFRNSNKLPSYSDAATHFGAVTSPAVQIMRDDSAARPHSVSARFA